jgi:hypothetical protein
MKSFFQLPTLTKIAKVNKCILLLCVIAFSKTANAQAGAKWSTEGNESNAGDFLGTTNNVPLIFKTGNTEWLQLGTDGAFRLKSLSSQGQGFIKFDNSGRLNPLNFTGSTNHILTGAGIFMNAEQVTGWKLNGGNLLNANSGNIGIGTQFPTAKFEINGTAKISDLTTNNFYLGSVSSANAGQVLTTDGSGKVGPLDPFALQQSIYKASQLSYLCLGDSSGLPVWLNKIPHILYVAPLCANVGIGTDNPQFKLDVIGNAHVSGTLKVGNNSIMIDATTTTSGNNNNIYGSANSHLLLQNTPLSTGYVGIGTGSPLAKLEVHGSENGNYAARVYNDGGSSSGLYIQAGSGSGAGNLIAAVSGDGGGNLINRFVVKGNSGNVGIGIPDPDSRLVVYSNNSTSIDNAPFKVKQVSSVHQKVAEFSDDQYRRMFFVPKLGGSGYNYLSHDDDMGLFWNDGTNASGMNGSAGFVIAPHAASGAGIKIKANGNVGVGFPDPQFRLDVAGSINASSYYLNGVLLSGLGNSTGNDLNVCGIVKAKKIIVETGWCDYVFDASYKLMPISEVEKYIKINKHLPGFVSEKEVLKKGLDVGETQVMQQEKIEEMMLYIIELKKEIEMLKVEKSKK